MKCTQINTNAGQPYSSRLKAKKATSHNLLRLKEMQDDKIIEIGKNKIKVERENKRR